MISLAAAALLTTWTIADIVTTPEVTELSQSGDKAFYVEHHSDLVADRVSSSLYVVDLRTRAKRLLLEAPWIESLRHIPRSEELSVLADIGAGVQLYRLDPQGRIHSILVRREPVSLGPIQGTIANDELGPPRRAGVIAYEWAPDGKTLWYVTASAQKPARVLRNEDAWWDSYRRIAISPGKLFMRVRTSTGEDILVTERPSQDIAALYFGGSPRWSADSMSVDYIIGADGKSEPTFSGRTWSLRERRDVASSKADARDLYPRPRGSGGGMLLAQRVGEEQRLVEQMPDGSQRDWGPAPFSVADPRGAGAWQTRDGQRSVFGIRFTAEHPHYSLGVLDASNGFRLIETQGSLTRCDFVQNLDHGVCVRESMTRAPDLVTVNVGTGAINPVISMAPVQASISPLRTEPRTWMDRHGRTLTGFITYPRDYVPGHQYAAIVANHGNDADERFVAHDFQWEYPLQVFAERGYVVVSLNEPSPRSSPESEAAYQEYRDPHGAVAHADVQRLLWIETVQSFEDVVRALAAEGLVDTARVGIVGYSAGSQMVNVAMTQLRLFRAASSGEGGFLEPAGYFTLPQNAARYAGIYAGSPYDPAAAEDYLRLSPTFRARLASGAILQQVANPRESFVHFYAELRAASVPSQLSAYLTEPAIPETHLFHVPSNRVAAMKENLDWFDFWLLDRMDSDSQERERNQQWRSMRDRACAAKLGITRCEGVEHSSQD
jgi:dipeptidyl aminopeptidase/acylaminoacyl peptidase